MTYLHFYTCVSITFQMFNMKLSNWDFCADEHGKHTMNSVALSRVLRGVEQIESHKCIFCNQQCGDGEGVSKRHLLLASHWSVARSPVKTWENVFVVKNVIMYSFYGNTATIRIKYRRIYQCLIYFKSMFVQNS